MATGTEVKLVVMEVKGMVMVTEFRRATTKETRGATVTEAKGVATVTEAKGMVMVTEATGDMGGGNDRRDKGGFSGKGGEYYRILNAIKSQSKNW